MIVNTFGIATNTALALRVGPKYLHLPKTNREIKEKILEFETKVGMIQLFGCIAGTHVPFACPSEHSHDYFRTKNSIYLSYKLYAIINVLLVLNISGLVVFTTHKYLETLLLANVQ